MLSFAICTSLIMPPSLSCMSIVFISLGTTLITKRKKKNGYAKGGANKVYYGRCANGQCPFQKKRFLVLNIIFYKIKISALQKNKKKEEE